MSVKQWITPLKGIDSLSLTEVPMPAPGPNEVLVEIRAVSLNYRDVEGTTLAKRCADVHE
jgi:NADPH:quinone reductase-like Zn-dependent oxidoreductase